MYIILTCIIVVVGIESIDTNGDGTAARRSRAAGPPFNPKLSIININKNAVACVLNLVKKGDELEAHHPLLSMRDVSTLAVAKFVARY